jgi:hypothetical protein
VTTDTRGSFTWRDAATDAPIAVTGGPRGSMRGVLAPDLGRAAFADRGGQVFVFDPEARTLQPKLPSQGREVTLLAFAADSKSLLIAWGDTIPPTPAGDKPRADAGTKDAPPVAPETAAALAKEPFGVHRLDLTSGKPVGVYAGAKAPVRRYTTAAGGATLIGLSEGRSPDVPPALRAWDAETAKPLWTQPLPDRRAEKRGATRTHLYEGFLLAEGGTTGVWWSWDVAGLFDVRTGKTSTTFDRQKNAIDSVAFDPDGKRIWTVAVQDAARAYDLTSGKVVKTVELNGLSGTSSRFILTPQKRVVETNTSEMRRVQRDLGD